MYGFSAEFSAPLARHPAVFVCLPHWPVAFHPTHFTDITDFEEAKIRLLQSHRSQAEAMRRVVGQGFDKLCQAPDAYWGQQVCCEFAECFRPLLSRGAVKPFSVLP